MKKLKIIMVVILLLLSFFSIVQTSFAITTREQMMTIAESYANHTWTPTKNNVCSNKCCIEWDGGGECAKEVDCIVNTPDRNTHTDWSNDRGWKWEKDESGNYLQNISVPYQWGGCSSIGINGIRLKNVLGCADFDPAIGNKKCAGDARGSGSKSKYAVGVDCSGFVSRTWNLKSKQSTWTFPNISKKLESYNDLKNGDILNRTGGARHVMLFNEFLDSESPHIDLEVYESMGYYWKVKTSKYNIKKEIENEGYLPYTSFPSDRDVVIVIDISKSMEGNSMEKAKETLDYFVDTYSSGTRLGVVVYSDLASVAYPLTMLENDQIKSKIKETSKNYIDARLGGETFTAGGLELAREELNKSIYSNSPKNVVLISDGYESPEDREDPNFVYLNNVIAQIIQDKITIDAIRTEWQELYIPSEPWFALADEENPSSNFAFPNSKSGKFEHKIQLMMAVPPRYDYSNFSEEQARRFLQMIADDANGKYRYISNLESFFSICKDIYDDYYEQERNLKTMRGEIFPNQMIVRNFLVDPSMERITFFLFWPGSELDFTLIQPDGIEINPDSENSDISFSSSGTFKVYRIDAPANGLWQLKIYGKEVSSSGEDYIISIEGLLGIDLDASFDKDKYPRNSSVKIFASVVDQILDVPEEHYIYNAEVKAKIKNPDGNLYNIDLFDADNNGIYIGEFSETSIAGQYDFAIEFSGGLNNETNDPFIREKTISAIIAPSSPPIADAGGPYTTAEGLEVTFDASASSDPDGDELQYRWDFENDGVWDMDWSTNPTAAHTWPDDYQGAVKLEVSDGELADTNTANITVNNANPVVNAGENQTVEVFGEAILAGNFTDSGWLDTHSASIDWGDGAVENIPLTEENSVSESSGQITASHIYNIPGIYTAALTITDDEGGMGVGEAVITIKKRETFISYIGEVSGQYSDEAELKAKLSDKAGSIAGKTVHFTIGAQSTSAAVNGDGIAAVEIALDQIPGNYTVETNFQGDDYYLASSDSDKFEIFKENVIIEVWDQEGFWGDTVILKAAILDDDGKTLNYPPNKASFAVGGHPAGEVIIGETGQAVIDWLVDYAPDDFSEPYIITVAFSENKYYSQTQGRGKFTLKSAKQLKQDSLAKLKNVQTENKQVKTDIDKAIEDIENSLALEPWIDASHLDSQHGHKVFDREKQAVKNLLKIIEERGKHNDSKIAAELQAIVDNIVKVDILIARTAIYDAENMTTENLELREKIEKEVNKAKEELEKALREIAGGNSDKAIDFLKRAWDYAQSII